MRNIFILLSFVVVVSCNKDTHLQTEESVSYNEKILAIPENTYIFPDGNFIRIDKVENGLCCANQDIECFWEGEFYIHFSARLDNEMYQFTLGSSPKTSKEVPFTGYHLNFYGLSPYECNAFDQSKFRISFSLGQD
ncbi:MAG: hypothetical protein J5I52_02665 [Saprospiraceae bacterium]|nr:MAG: hypothetical protein UZ09_BCD002001961 [Bacteroidetes bacterium OLB9]MCO6463032.1 hypothetical protein [Saprospiraceae bacterium]